MKFNADEIASVIQQEIEQFESQIDVQEMGTVLEVGDGIAHEDHLPVDDRDGLVAPKDLVRDPRVAPTDADR